MVHLYDLVLQYIDHYVVPLSYLQSRWRVTSGHVSQFEMELPIRHHIELKVKGLDVLGQRQ